MPQTLGPPQTPPEPAPNPKRWTRQECEFLVQNELLDGRYELIEGEIISKMGQHRPHAIAVMLITGWLMRVFGDVFIQCQGPINVADADNETNEPEPDVAALARPMNTYTTHAPGPTDVLLVVEVSDTTLRFDLRNKAALYARAGIKEYWVVDVVARRIIAHRQPDGESYSEILEYAAEEMIAPLAHASASVRVTELLAPSQNV